jgi:phosphatidylglycerophosphate synthase
MAPAPATLLILPGAAVPGETALLGLTLAKRIELAARRAGFEEVLYATGVQEGAGRGFAIRSDVVATKDGMKKLLEGAGDPSSTSGLFPLRSPDDLPAAERWLLASLVKDTEGFMSRHVERKVSLAITRRLVGTRITPNQMTIGSVFVGLVGAGFFLSTRPALEVTGALLFLLHSILDGCDGELARLKYLESRWGGILDFWGDNVVHVAVFMAIALGWRTATGESWPLLLGASAALGTLLSAAFVYKETMAVPKEGPQFTSVTSAPSSRLSRLADALARRDFIYLVVVLAAFGKAHWFLVLAAVGSPAFFAVLLVVAALGRRVERRLA